MPGTLRGINTSCDKKYSDWKYDIKEHLTINGPQNRYGGCTDTQWQKAIEFFRRLEITKRSVVNKENRKKLKELSYGGSQSIPALRYKKCNLETGQLEPIPDSWMDTHHKSGTGRNCVHIATHSRHRQLILRVPHQFRVRLKMKTYLWYKLSSENDGATRKDMDVSLT
ncbi:uncharacterized protein LOC133814285 [Humulus lupulus]|uniref:uncharacterized protein LOC133814285 n=1 Tax=Humulus lupulus TaxID=3486 RepID=UPI002B409278|nr:uncharacterized protein LOC133814285 [Humulus lupulus]